MEEDNLDVSLENERNEEIQGEGEENGGRKKEHRHRHHHRKHKHHRRSGEEKDQSKLSGKRKKKSGEASQKLRKVKDDEDLIAYKIIDENVAKLIDNIVGAAEVDKQNKAEGKLALEKIKLLPEIKSQLKKTQYHETFLEKKGLYALSLWTQRNEDGSYPCFDILQGVLDICGDLPVTTDNLLECGKELGRSIKEIYKTSESEQLRVKAKRLIDKWSRNIYGIETNSYNLSEKEDGYTQYLRHLNKNFKRREEKEKIEEENDSDDLEDEKNASQKASKAAPPIRRSLAAVSKVGFDFIKRPASQFIPDRKGGGRKEESAMSELKRKMVQVKRDGKKKPAVGL